MNFSARLLAWYDKHGRHDLPWQQQRTPYKVWLSEIMLQQTQVATVIPFYTRFLARFPDLPALAAAQQDEVLALWAGLGYYARARNLHLCAQTVMSRHGGEFPSDLEAMMALPGIGRSTAGAILAQAHDARHPILDGNVRRVLARHGAVSGWPGEPAVQKKLWALAQRHLPYKRLADYTQALMDLGATVCTARKPACGICPLREDCAARLQGRVAELPAARPRRERPQRRAVLLLVENADGELLLEKRPSSGIWGALWCPPMSEDEDGWRALLRERYALQPGPATPLPVIRHGFTHFDLDLLPLRLRAAPLAGVREDGGRRWIRMDALADTGLPAPVRKLLQSPHLALDALQCPEPSTA